MSIYIIAQITIRDRNEYSRYEDGFDDIFGKYKGLLISVDEDPVVLEGEWPYTRTVLMTFPSEQEARRWYESPEYQQLAKIRRNASKANIVMIKRM
jgi:uncharacterized protein (DUF1330 family)